VLFSVFFALFRFFISCAPLPGHFSADAFDRGMFSSCGPAKQDYLRHSVVEKIFAILVHLLSFENRLDLV